MKKFNFIIFFIIILSSILAYVMPAYGIDNQTIRIAIIDTGISSHAISSKNLVEGKNYILSNRSTEDEIGHGTAVAGIIVGSEKAGIKGYVLQPNWYH